MSDQLLRVVRFDKDGAVFHNCITTTPVNLDTDEHGTVCVDMPLRYWRMCSGGRIEISNVELCGYQFRGFDDVTCILPKGHKEYEHKGKL